MINIKYQQGGKLFTFLCLYMAQSIPKSFFSTILPVMMRQNEVSLEIIGLLNLLKLPWILKFLWSPGVDRSSFRLNDFKRWIFSSELIYAAAIFSVAFLDLAVTPHLIFALVLLAFIASATQDIATDSLAVLSFEKKDRSLANSMQSVGSFVGTMVGSGVMLYLMHYKLDWSQILFYLGLFVIIALIPLFFFRRSEGNPVLKEKQKEKPHINDLWGFFKQKGIWKQVIFLFLFYAGLIGILSMIRPLLVDYGYNMKQIGTISIIGTAFGCIGSFLGGFIVRRLGRHTSRILFAGVILFATAYFSLLVTYLPLNTATLHLGICLLWGSYGMATIIVYTTAMDRVRPGYEGTDFTLQTVITHASGVLVGVSSGKIAAEITYKGLFHVELIVATISLLFILWAFGLKEKKEEIPLSQEELQKQ